jgi:5'-nucleotidase / UDP-sugar diphosphatase
MCAGIDFAIQNGGSIRAALPQGQVTRSLIHEILPFDNSVVILTLHGCDVQSLFTYMATTVGRRAFPQVSDGLSFTINQGTGKLENILINGNPIDPNRVYRMATNSYLAAGGNGYKVLLKAVDRYDTSIFQSDVLAEYIKYIGGRIRPKVQKRVTVIKSNKTRHSPRKYQKTHNHSLSPAFAAIISSHTSTTVGIPSHEHVNGHVMGAKAPIQFL